MFGEQWFSTIGRRTVLTRCALKKGDNCLAIKFIIILRYIYIGRVLSFNNVELTNMFTCSVYSKLRSSLLVPVLDKPTI